MKLLALKWGLRCQCQLWVNVKYCPFFLCFVSRVYIIIVRAVIVVSSFLRTNKQREIYGGSAAAPQPRISIQFEPATVTKNLFAKMNCLFVNRFGHPAECKVIIWQSYYSNAWLMPGCWALKYLFGWGKRIEKNY